MRGGEGEGRSILRGAFGDYVAFFCYLGKVGLFGYVLAGVE